MTKFNDQKKRKDVEPLKPGQKSGTPEVMAVTYGCSLGTLNNLRSKGNGPKYFVQGRRIFYRVIDFESWLFQNPVQTINSHRDARG